MRKLLKYLKDYKLECILAPLFKLFEACFELLTPVIIAKIIDDGIKNSDKPFILKMVGLLVLLGVAGFAFAVIAQYFSAKAAAGMGTDMRRAIFVKVNSLSFSALDKIGTDKIITRMTSDANQVQTTVNMSLRLLLRAPIIVFGAVICAFMIDAKSALVFTATIPVLLAVVFAITLISMKLFSKAQGGLEKLLGITRENLTGVRQIRAFCNEEKEAAEFDRQNDLLVKFQKIAGGIGGLLSPLTFIIINLGIAALIYTGALQIKDGIITQGALVALYNYMSQILVELIKFANFVINLTKGAACGARVSDLLEFSDEKKFAADGETDDFAVRFDDVCFSYTGASPDGKYSLRNINFSAKRGECIGIIGSTGSGKSTLVNLIPRFYDATEGSVFVLGKNTLSYPDGELVPKVAVVPQKSILFSGTLAENMRLGNKDATDEEIMSAIKSACGEDIAARVGGLDGYIAAGGKNLSGGQRARLCIARAIVKKSEILILDDSASALDFSTDAKLRKNIANLSPRPTTFIVSQRASSVMRADKIIVLDGGEIVGMGTHEELLAECDVYREIYSSQFEDAKGAAV